MGKIPPGLRTSPGQFMINVDVVFDFMIRKGKDWCLEKNLPIPFEAINWYAHDVFLATATFAVLKVLFNIIPGNFPYLGLRVNFDKRVLGADKLPVLSTMSLKSNSPLDYHIQRIVNMPLPRTAKDLRTFLGIVRYKQFHVRPSSEFKLFEALPQEFRLLSEAKQKEMEANVLQPTNVVLTEETIKTSQYRVVNVTLYQKTAVLPNQNFQIPKPVSLSFSTTEKTGLKTHKPHFLKTSGKPAACKTSKEFGLAVCYSLSVLSLLFHHNSVFSKRTFEKSRFNLYASLWYTNQWKTVSNCVLAIKVRNFCILVVFAIYY